MGEIDDFWHRTLGVGHSVMEQFVFFPVVVLISQKCLQLFTRVLFAQNFGTWLSREETWRIFNIQVIFYYSPRKKNLKSITIFAMSKSSFIYGYPSNARQQKPFFVKGSRKSSCGETNKKSFNRNQSFFNFVFLIKKFSKSFFEAINSLPLTVCWWLRCGPKHFHLPMNNSARFIIITDFWHFGRVEKSFSYLSRPISPQVFA